MGRYNPAPSDPQTIFLQRSNAEDLQSAAQGALLALVDRLVSAVSLSGAGAGSRFTLSIEHTSVSDGKGIVPAQLAAGLRLFSATSAEAISSAYDAALASAQTASPGLPLADALLSGSASAAMFLGAVVVAAVSDALPWPGSLSCGPLINGAYREILPAGAMFPTDVVWYLDASKTTELLHTTYTRNGSGLATQITHQVYDLFGVLVLTVTDVVNFDGLIETDRTRSVA